MSQPSFDPASLPNEVIDLATLEQLLDLDDGELGLIQEMLQLFRDDTPPRLALIEAAIQQDQPIALSEAAHAVKGAASTMGAPRVRAIAAELEAAGRKESSVTGYAGHLAQMRIEFAQSLEAMLGFIAAR